MTPEKNQIDFLLFVWIWNHQQGLETPALHRQICRWLEQSWQQGKRKILIQAFRASGKSTLAALFCVWMLINNRNLRILVLAAEQGLAMKMTGNIKSIIERHILSKNLKPAKTDHWAGDRMTVQRSSTLRDPSVLARGLTANLTGCRADLVICDDVEVPNSADSAAKRADLRCRLSEIDFILTPGGGQIYLGTPHGHPSIYASPEAENPKAEKAFLANFERLTLPVLDKNGHSIWPERYPQEALSALRERHGPIKFDSQMLLQPRCLEDSRLDPGKLRPYDGEPSHITTSSQSAASLAEVSLANVRLVAASCWWDPAYGREENRDSSVIACVFVSIDGRYWLHAVDYLKTRDPAEAGLDEARQQCHQVVDFLRQYHLPGLHIESNGIGAFLPGLLRQILQERNLAASVRTSHSRQAKYRRIIEALDAPLASGHLMAHRRIWHSPLIDEIRNWQPHRKTGQQDDGLDAVAGCILSQPVRLRPGAPAPPLSFNPFRISSHLADSRFIP